MSYHTNLYTFELITILYYNIYLILKESTVVIWSLNVFLQSNHIWNKVNVSHRNHNQLLNTSVKKMVVEKLAFLVKFP